MKHRILFALIAFCADSLFARAPTILVVMSSASTLLLDDDRPYPTGVFLNELYLPVKDLRQLGFVIQYATPDGKPATTDPESLKAKYWKSESLRDEAIRYTNTDQAYLHPETLDRSLIKISEYAGIVVPGGQGLMVDLIHDARVPKLLTAFHARRKPIGLICHAPVLLTRFAAGENPFRGYKANSVARMEEWYIETFVMKGSPRIRRIARLLENAELEYESSFFPGQGYAVRDRHLVTSQNPFSGNNFITLFRQALWQAGQIPAP